MWLASHLHGFPVALVSPHARHGPPWRDSSSPGPGRHGGEADLAALRRRGWSRQSYLCTRNRTRPPTIAAARSTPTTCAHATRHLARYPEAWRASRASRSCSARSATLGTSFSIHRWRSYASTSCLNRFGLSHAIGPAPLPRVTRRTRPLADSRIVPPAHALPTAEAHTRPGAAGKPCLSATGQQIVS